MVIAHTVRRSVRFDTSNTDGVPVSVPLHARAHARACGAHTYVCGFAHTQEARSGGL